MTKNAPHLILSRKCNFTRRESPPATAISPSHNPPTTSVEDPQVELTNPYYSSKVHLLKEFAKVGGGVGAGVELVTLDDITALSGLNKAGNG